MEGLKREVLEDLLTLGLEETTDFLDASLLNEELFVLKSVAVVRIIAHQELS